MNVFHIEQYEVNTTQQLDITTIFPSPKSDSPPQPLAFDLFCQSNSIIYSNEKYFYNVLLFNQTLNSQKKWKPKLRRLLLNQDYFNIRMIYLDFLLLTLHLIFVFLGLERLMISKCVVKHALHMSFMQKTNSESFLHALSVSIFPK